MQKLSFLPKPISSSSEASGVFSFFLAAGASAALAAPAAGAAAAGAAAPAAGADPKLVIKLKTSTLDRALAKRPGQYGAASYLAAFKMALILSPCYK